MIAARSAIYRGTVRHRRKDPIEHAFTYDVGMLYIDLGELDAGVLEHPPLWSSCRRRAIAGVAREDLLGDTATPLDEAVRALVLERTRAWPTGPIGLLTTPRTFGRAFNPVSFYFCFEDDGATLAAVVADVENTPWNERHAYVVRAQDRGRVLDAELDKVFHVSPAMGMDQRYRWSLTTPGRTLSVHIESTSRSTGTPTFDATLNLRREPLTRASLHRLLARFPLQSARTGALIYANALRLKLKGAPYHAHPDARPAHTT